MLMALKGQRSTQMPQPMHSVSEMKAVLEAGVTSMHCLPAPASVCGSVRRLQLDWHWRQQTHPFARQGTTCGTLGGTSWACTARWGGVRVAKSVGADQRHETTALAPACAAGAPAWLTLSLLTIAMRSFLSDAAAMVSTYGRQASCKAGTACTPRTAKRYAGL